MERTEAFEAAARFLERRDAADELYRVDLALYGFDDIHRRHATREVDSR
jgi:hypothetical protein